MVLMSLCGSTTKNKIENMSEYPKLLKRLDSLGLLSIIKKTSRDMEPSGTILRA